MQLVSTGVSDLSSFSAKSHSQCIVSELIVTLVTVAVSDPSTSVSVSISSPYITAITHRVFCVTNVKLYDC